MDKGTPDATNMINSFIMIDKLSENGWEFILWISRSLVESKPIKIETPSYMIGPNVIYSTNL